ncbi:MAG: hypothetical protein HQ572_02130 [Candidatus Omnitrophica bacterium]|nr:hypothetical protein [Candidatus Omnitrophota bacterium]
MKKSTYLYRCVLYLVALAILLAPTQTYAGKSGNGRIRVMSSKKNEQLHNKITIDLVNGKSKYVSLDNMIKLIKEYGVIELSSSDVKPAEEMLTKEVAYRMLKHHYLPRIGDKIKVYKQQTAFQREAGLGSSQVDLNENTIELPLDIATVADENRLRTIYWGDLVVQISSAVEKLWLNRIRYLNSDPSNLYAEKGLIDAASLIRRKYIQKGRSEEAVDIDSDVSRLINVADNRLKAWLADGEILEQDMPLVAEMLIHFIMLSNATDIGHLASELEAIEDLDAMKRALIAKINIASEIVKNNNPQDYAAFAMLQSLLDDIVKRFAEIKKSDSGQLLNIRIGHGKSRHSA